MTRNPGYVEKTVHSRYRNLLNQHAQQLKALAAKTSELHETERELTELGTWLNDIAAKDKA